MEVVDEGPPKPRPGRRAAAKQGAMHGHSTVARRGLPVRGAQAGRAHAAAPPALAATISASVRSVAKDLYAYSGAAAKMML